jgi:signal transduction histidine kinase
VRRADGTAVVEVADRGIGVAPADRERIFEPFRRLDAGAATPGMGLGLAVTRRLVERQGGHIAVESEPGRGSTFRVELPVAAPA